MKSLIFSILIVISSGWLGLGLDMLLGNDVTEGLGKLFLLMLPTLAMVLFSIKRLGSLGFHPHFKRHYKWYLFAALFDIAAFLIITGIGYLAGGIEERMTGDLFSTILTASIATLPVLFVKNIFEEINWRGFLFPRLHEYMGYQSASFLSSLIWATWHLPLWLVMTPRTLLLEYSPYQNVVVFVVTAYLALLNMGFLYNRIRLSTGSVWPTVLLHTMNNAIVAALYANLHYMKWFISPGINGILYFAILLLVNLYLEIKHPSKPEQHA
jgi:membrane protease YdiL (CAAX protease family)